MSSMYFWTHSSNLTFVSVLVFVILRFLNGVALLFSALCCVNYSHSHWSSVIWRISMKFGQQNSPDVSVDVFKLGLCSRHNLHSSGDQSCKNWSGAENHRYQLQVTRSFVKRKISNINDQCEQAKPLKILHFK